MNGSYRVKKDNRCQERYKPSGGAEVKCTKEKGHKGKHACQLQNGRVIEVWGSKPKRAEIRLTSDTSKIVGADKSKYGPFEEGEETELPFDTAWMLVEREKAEWIEGEDQ